MLKYLFMKNFQRTHLSISIIWVYFMQLECKKQLQRK